MRNENLPEDYVPLSMDGLFSAKQIFRKTVECVSRHGFDGVTYGAIVQTLSGPKEIMLNNYPPDWNDYYMLSRYKECDPVIEHALTSLSYSIWSPQMFSKNIKSKQMFNEINEDIGMRVGITIPVRDRLGSVASVNFVGRSRQPQSFWTDTLLGYLYMLAVTMHENIVTAYYREHQFERDVKLTHAEINVARLLASGKTSSEASKICDCAERTIEYHLKNIREKLDAPNTLNAIFKASQLGLL